MQTRRIARPFLLVLLVLLALAPATAAFADQPVRIPVPASDVTIPATNCGFPVKIEYSLQKEFMTSFAPNGGRPFDAMVTGVLHSTVTNLDTGKSLYYNISGPGRLTFHPDGSFTFIGGGPAGWPFAGQTDMPLGYPGIFVAKGYLAMEFDAASHLLSLTTNGHIEDVCAALSN